MNRSFLLASLVALCLPVWHDVVLVSAQQQTAETQSVEERLKADPNSTATLNEYMIGQLRQLMPQINSAPDEAQKILDSMKTTLDALEPTEEAAQSLLGKAKEAVGFYAKQLELARTSLDDLRAKLNDNPDDADTIGMFIQKVMQQVGPLAGSQAAEAEQQLETHETFLEGLKDKISSEEAKQALAAKERPFGQLRSVIERTKKQLELARTSLDDLRAKLNDNPDDANTIEMFIQKVMQQVGPLAGSQAAEAEHQLETHETFLEGLKDKISSEEAKQALAAKERMFGQLRSVIERTKRLEAIVGSEAAPLNVEAWINGDPLTDEDLKGKVVLLDFWAIWCGPCIATFPHLREWQEKYADKGLVIIGLTNYYNHVWNEEAARPTRSQEKVTPEQEHEMLQKFAEHHNLQHRFAIAKDKSLAEFYGVSGIPHVVVIDREGKVQLMRIGSGEATAKAIEAKIDELIAKGA